ncbi:MAG: hybrid sensor histidine kinase/response regulator, partial [Burkholderiaceae bacterium]
AVEAIPQAVCIGSARGVMHCNRACLLLLGVDAVRELPQTVALWVSRFHFRRQRAGPLLEIDAVPFARALRGEESELEIWITPVEGKDIFLRATAVPLWRNDRVVGALSINYDLTQQLELEHQRETLARAKSELRERDQQLRALLRDAHTARVGAQQASQAREEFLATVSHELRTPLTAILGWATVLERGQPDPQKAKHGLASIARNARAQARLIEELLDLNRLQSGLLQLELQPLEPVCFVDAAVQGVLPQAEAKGVRIDTDFEDDLGRVDGDAQRLQQVVRNILGNAVKFTPSGGEVTVRLRRRQEEIEILVEDTGSGITPEGVTRIFERFQQVDASSTRRHGGLGIGLAIVRELVQLHGGSVHAHSRGRGLGASFTVLLPSSKTGTTDAKPLYPAETAAAGETAAPIVQRTASPASSARLDGVTLLLVDDEPDGRELAAHVLSEAGARVLSAASAREGFDLFRRHRPDAVLSDIAMAVHDGYDLMRWIRTLDGSEGGETPAVAITAFAGSDDVGRALRAGFQAHLAKPLEPTRLVAVVAGLLKRVG